MQNWSKIKWITASKGVNDGCSSLGGDGLGGKMIRTDQDAISVSDCNDPVTHSKTFPYTPKTEIKGRQGATAAGNERDNITREVRQEADESLQSVSLKVHRRVMFNRQMIICTEPSKEEKPA